MPRITTVVGASLLALLAACHDAVAPRSDGARTPGATALNYNVALPHFTFLDPIASPSALQSPFDPTLEPRVTVWDCGAGPRCDGWVGRTTMFATLHGDMYKAIWDVAGVGATTGRVYQVYVTVGEATLGIREIQFVANPGDPGMEGSDATVLPLTASLPIAFRVGTEAVGIVAISAPDTIVTLGETMQLGISAGNLRGEPVPTTGAIWSSSDEGVASIDQDGLLTANAVGEFKVFVRLGFVAGWLRMRVAEQGPPPGRDIAVFNDVNVFDDFAMADPDNQRLVRNLVGFSGTGPRASGTQVWFDLGRPNACFGNCTVPLMRSTIAAAGFGVADVNSNAGAFAGIPATVKAIFLWLPTLAYTTAEVNALKQFAAEGGRVVFVGEHEGYYGASGIAIENQFLTAMGAVLRNTGGAIDCGRVAMTESQLRPAQITEGVITLQMGCASVIAPGPEDYPLFYDRTGTRVLAGVARIDTTPVAGLRMAATAMGLMAQMDGDPAFVPSSTTGR